MMKKQSMRQVNEQLQVNLNHILEELTKTEKKNHQLNLRVKELEKEKLKFQTPPRSPMKDPVKDEDILKGTRRIGDFLQFELQVKEEEMRKLQSILDERTKQLADIRVNAEQEWHRSKEQQKIIEQQCQTIAKLETQLFEQKSKYDRLLLEKNQQVCFQVELEHLRHDNAKFLSMLQTTKEYKEIADCQMGSEGRLRFLHKLPKDDKENRLQWVPEKAHQFAQQFRQMCAKEGNMISEELIDSLLYELNKIWSKKNENDMRVLRKNCQFEVSKVQRQKSADPLNVVESKQTIERLRKEISRLEAENRELFGKRPSSNPIGAAVTTRSSNKKAVKERKSPVLQKQQSSLQNEKLMYYDGALWAVRQIREKFKTVPALQEGFDVLKQIESQIGEAQRNLH